MLLAAVGLSSGACLSPSPGRISPQFSADARNDAAIPVPNPVGKGIRSVMSHFLSLEQHGEVQVLTGGV